MAARTSEIDLLYFPPTGQWCYRHRRLNRRVHGTVCGEIWSVMPASVVSALSCPCADFCPSFGSVLEPCEASQRRHRCAAFATESERCRGAWSAAPFPRVVAAVGWSARLGAPELPEQHR
eukprot:SAG25_NODE_502_length_7356_cov_70.227642_7_plen_120_part_00